MDTLPFDLPGRFWRGNLHTHSDMSDGKLPPAEVAELYHDQGYDFLSITDHFRERYGFPVTDTRPLRTEGFTTIIGAELHAPGHEFSDDWHIVAVGLPFDFARPAEGETAPELARRARAAGAWIGMAHPAAALLTVDDAERLDAAHAVECYNVLATREDRGDSWHFYDMLVGRGARLHAYAADDAHFSGHGPAAFGAWVQVRAERLDPAELLAALKAGKYYSSTGPELHHVAFDGDHLVVRTSPASVVMVSGGVPAPAVAEGDERTEWRLPLARLQNSPFLRVTVGDAAGGRAWSNPVWLDR
ncbi:PHP domain-containing protein [Sinosporangium siamense]|uniref:Phosphotransferase n=1 Tax=Sinosporangium siamense TaxID=1367973 RepID=A0A919RIF3_9ACTN|nr:CehA/McbA family metallohydrolase [Sinosporangium siamense]GII94408.1 phosphotransferase [Sinosporangium siamense]